eukprot:CAMPEP_0177615596 /NCGR_PEP_ID=MMETSP0419_2-20121207/23551_1 /TAXON_ID=582737 /ORGANISM="Tetraselmis sp., Strain GSL018" /LENGTH=926 /DNA_ID=CAMNT_0019113287 /DNA_START=322 /DNA_END=3102 /DNA_ORIENTATION=+
MNISFVDLGDVTTRKVPMATTSCGERDADFFIGPYTSSQAVLASHIAEVYGAGVISHTATSPSLSNTDLYPTFVRTVPSDAALAVGVDAFIRRMGWKQVAVMHTGDAFGSAYAQFLGSLLRTTDGTSVDSISVGEDPTQDTVSSAVDQAISRKLWVLIVVLHGSDSAKLIQAVEASEMNMSDFTVILGAQSIEAIIQHLLDSNLDNMLPKIEGWIGVSPSYDESLAEEHREHFMDYITSPSFPRDVAQLYTSPMAGDEGGPAALEETIVEGLRSIPHIDTGPRNYVPQIYDAVWLAAMSAAAAEAEGLRRPLGAQSVQAIMDGKVPPFSGATFREWRWDANGDVDMRTAGVQLASYGRQPGQAAASPYVFADYSERDGLRFLEGVQLIWADGSTYPERVPGDGSVSLSHQRSVLLFSVLGCVAFAAAAAVVASLLLVRRNRKLNRIISLHYKEGLNGMDLEAPITKLYAFLESLKAGKRPDAAEIARLQTYLRSVDDLKNPDLEGQLDREHGINPYLRDHLMSTLLPSREAHMMRAELLKVESFKSESRRAAMGNDSSKGLESFNALLQDMAYSRDPALQKLFASIGHDPMLDPFQLSKASGGRPLTSVCVQLAISFGLGIGSPNRADFSQQCLHLVHLGKFHDYVAEIEDGYHQENSYHNSTHAADVTNRAVALARMMGIIGEESNLRQRQLLVAVIVAAAVHDFDHPGTTNDFQVKTASEAAMLHNDQHVLENHSLYKSMKMLQSDELNFISSWSYKDQHEFRTRVIDMVLATDMSRHFDIVGSFTSKFVMDKDSQKDGWKGNTVDFWNLSKSGQSICLQMALKAADIGHTYAQWDVHYRWCKALEDEMFAQGDLEIAHKLPISPLMNRKQPGCSHPNNQVGFYDVIVMPLLKALTDVFSGAATCFEAAEINKALWKDRAGIVS